MMEGVRSGQPGDRRLRTGCNVWQHSVNCPLPDAAPSPLKLSSPPLPP